MSYRTFILVFGMVLLTPSTSAGEELPAFEGASDGVLELRSSTLALVSHESEADELVVRNDLDETARYALDGCSAYGWMLSTSQRPRRPLVRGTACFYVYDVRHGLLGPADPVFDGEGADAQSGMIADLRRWKEKHVLVGYQVDSGPFAYLDWGKNLEEIQPVARSNQVAVFWISRKEPWEVAVVTVDGWEITSVEVVATSSLDSPINVVQSKNQMTTALEYGEGQWIAVSLHTGEVYQLHGKDEWTSESLDAFLDERGGG